MLDTKTMLNNISKGQSAIPLKYIIAGLENEYNNLKNTTILDYVGFKDGIVTIYYKCPSNSIPNLYYDVVIKFYVDEKQEKIKTTDKFQLYCNSPSFYFRYANLFRKYGSLLFPSKYPSMVDVPAEVRNPHQATGFDKYVYTCLRLSMLDSIMDMKKEAKSKSEPHVKSFNEKRFEYLKKKKLIRIKKDEEERDL